jgi:cysteine desulfurase
VKLTNCLIQQLLIKFYNILEDMNFPIFLDYHSTTPVDPRVFEFMSPYFTGKFGNASSKHTFGYEADAVVKYSRQMIADLIGSEPGEIYFTGGATESINIVHSGIAKAYAGKGKKIISSATEHSASYESLKNLEKYGYTVTFLPVDKEGIINIDELKAAIDEQTILLSIMTANNETGTIQDIPAIGGLCKDKNVLFHTDAAQAIGKIKFNVNDMNADMVSFTAHKFYGSKGIGALFVRNRDPKIKIEPLTFGGGHENGLRPGTLNVPGIAGFGKAAELCLSEMENDITLVKSLRDKLYNGFKSGLDDVYLNGSETNRLYNNLNVSFEGVKSETLITSMREIAVSSGAACSSASLKPSRTLTAMGIPVQLVKSAIRFGLGRFNNEEEIDYTINKVIQTVTDLRKSSPAYSINN